MARKTRFARQLRRSMTDAESRIWYHLRNRRLGGYKFRRQWPLGPYIADFACLEHGLIVELDGSQHADSACDAIRDRYLQGLGFTVLRFWDNAALNETEAVCASILRWLGDR